MQFNLNVTPVTLLNFGGTAQKEIEICFQCSCRVVSNLGLYHMISIQLVAIATFCFATRNTLLDFSATAQNEIGFPIRVSRFVFYPGILMNGQHAFIHMIVHCALRCCATCIGTILNKC